MIKAHRQKIGCGPSTAPRTASRRSSALVLEHGFAERRHANDDPEARPAAFQVIAGDADHLAVGIQQRTAGVVTPSSLVDPRGGVGDRSILRSDEQRRLPWRSRLGRR
jgi:hypothetical protein